MEKLKELLIGVKDSYYDFVVGVLNCANNIGVSDVVKKNCNTSPY